jgi:hypothetical protein
MWRCAMPVVGDPLVRSAASRPKLIDAFLPKAEELVDASMGRIRVDRVHERPVALVRQHRRRHVHALT